MHHDSHRTMRRLRCREDYQFVYDSATRMNDWAVRWDSLTFTVQFQFFRVGLGDLPLAL